MNVVVGLLLLQDAHGCVHQQVQSGEQLGMILGSSSTTLVLVSGGAPPVADGPARLGHVQRLIIVIIIICFNLDAVVVVVVCCGP